MPLIHDEGSEKIQAFPLRNGMINKTTGTIECKMVACSLDGDITLVRFSETVSMTAGDVFTFEPQDVTVVSGKFHLA